MLTEEQRASWVAAAPNFPYNDVFGDSRVLSAPQLYSKLNLNLSKIGLPRIDKAPAPVEMPEFSASFFTLDATAITLVVSPNVPAGFHAVVRATPPVSAGILNVRTKLRDVQVFPAGGTPLDLSAAYTAKFGGTVVGQRVGFSVQLVSDESGQGSVPVFFNGIVGP
jgi:hypothetical protein